MCNSLQIKQFFICDPIGDDWVWFHKCVSLINNSYASYKMTIYFAVNIQQPNCHVEVLNYSYNVYFYFPILCWIIILITDPVEIKYFEASSWKWKFDWNKFQTQVRPRKPYFKDNVDEMYVVLFSQMGVDVFKDKYFYRWIYF